MFGFLWETLSKPSGEYASLFACAAVRPILYSSLQSDDSKFLLSLLFCFFRRADSDFLLDEKAF